MLFFLLLLLTLNFRDDLWIDPSAYLFEFFIGNVQALNVDELLADTYCEMYRHREKLRTHPNLCAWLITTLKYKAYDKLREKLQEYGNRDWLAEIDEYSTASNVLSPEDACIRKETIREIRKMIADTIGELCFLLSCFASFYLFIDDSACGVTIVGERA